MGPASTTAGENAETAVPNSLPPPPPVELSHRADQDGRAPDTPLIRKGQGEGRSDVGTTNAPLGAESKDHRTPAPRMPWQTVTTARDIRVGPAAASRASEGTAVPGTLPQNHGGTHTPPPPELYVGQSGVSGPVLPEGTPLHFPNGTTAGSQPPPGTPTTRGSAQAGQLPPAPLTLSYSPVQPAASPPPADPTTEAAAQMEESDYVRSLPDWARRFLKNSAGSPGEHPMGVARDIASLPHPAPEDTVQWTAPNYRPPEAPVTLREKPRQTQPVPAQGATITEAEIQRTADRVYRLLEERIRRERRRLGL